MRKTETTELLSALVQLLKIRPALDDFCRFGGSWESVHEHNERGWAQFHIVARGSCVVERPEMAPLILVAGDALLLPHGDRHIVRSRSKGAARPVSTAYRNGIRQRTSSQAETDTELLCGRLLFETTEENPLIAALPDELVVRTADDPLLQRFRFLLEEIRDELDSEMAGAVMIASDFARALFVKMLRKYLLDNPTGDGTLSLLQDRATARVVLALLSDLSRDWSLDDMAELAAASRATLVRTFRKHAGTAPMEFLSDLRLATARKRLLGTSEPVARIAAEVGYATEAALSKAMMRKYGVRPGALRAMDRKGAESSI